MTDVNPLSYERMSPPVSSRMRNGSAAVLATWRSLDTSNTGWSVETIKENWKTGAYILSHQARGLRVVAKQCRPKTFQVELYVHRDLLPAIGLRNVRLLGHCDDGASGWLFLEYANGAEYERNDRKHRRAAAVWLADLHAGARETRASEHLPPHDANRYLGHLYRAKAAIAGSTSDPRWDRDQRRALDAAFDLLDATEAIWSEISAVCAELPSTVVHGDFVSKHVRIRTRRWARSAGLSVFDWEMAGWGPPVPDLAGLPWVDSLLAANVDRAAYFRASRGSAHAADRDAVERSAWVGGLLRAVAALDWDSMRLEKPRAHRPLGNLPLYTEQIASLLHEAPWRA